MSRSASSDKVMTESSDYSYNVALDLGLCHRLYHPLHVISRLAGMWCIRRMAGRHSEIIHQHATHHVGEKGKVPNPIEHGSTGLPCPFWLGILGMRDKSYRVRSDLVMQSRMTRM